MEKAPEGSLVVSESNGCEQFYYMAADKSKKKKYIPVNQRNEIIKLAQKDYDEKFLKAALKEKKKIERILKSIPDTEIADVYSKLVPKRQKLVMPYVLTDEAFLAQWLSEEYNGKEMDEDLPLIITERGERVRSKSEKIIADKLYSMGIPYRYEYPLKLSGFGVVYPDFTLLNMNNRKEAYLEHFGMMDDTDYCRKAINKLEQYERNGIYMGKNLLVTFETSKQVLNMSVVEKKLKDMFML